MLQIYEIKLYKSINIASKTKIYTFVYRLCAKYIVILQPQTDEKINRKKYRNKWAKVTKVYPPRRTVMAISDCQN